MQPGVEQFFRETGTPGHERLSTTKITADAERERPSFIASMGATACH